MPLVPEVRPCEPLSQVTKARTSAWVMMLTYTPVMRRRNISQATRPAAAAGNTSTISRANGALANGTQNQGSFSTPL